MRAEVGKGSVDDRVRILILRNLTTFVIYGISRLSLIKA